MIRFILRFLGLMSLVAALTALICDGIRSIVDQTLYISTVGTQSWFMALQSAIERLAGVWHEAIQPYLLKQPAWLVLAIIGAILIWAKEETSNRTRARLRNSLAPVAMEQGHEAS
jgi:hypothetical protein